MPSRCPLTGEYESGGSLADMRRLLHSLSVDGSIRAGAMYLGARIGVGAATARGLLAELERKGEITRRKVSCHSGGAYGVVEISEREGA